MSATLTPKRKSARDRPASSKEREGGLGVDRGRESGRLTKELEVERRGVTLTEKTDAREKARAAANLMTQSRNLLFSRHSSRLALASSAAGRRAHDAAAVALDHSSSLAAAAARAVAIVPVAPY